MKKIVSLMLTVMMLFTFTQTIFASDWEILEQRYLSYQAEGELSFDLKKPLEMLDGLKDTVGFDVKYFMENLLKTKINMELHADISEDFKTFKVYMALNPKTPIYISEDLKLDYDVTGRMWMEFNIADPENAVMKIVIMNPLNGEYFYIDAFDEGLYASQEVAKEVKNAFFDSLDMSVFDDNELVDVIMDAYKKNGTIKKLGDEYVITFTNNALVDAVGDMIASIYTSESMKNVGVELDETSIAQAVALVKGMGIFADDDAYVYKIKLTRRGIIQEASESVHLDFNIFDAATVLGASSDALQGITKANSDIDLVINSKMVYKNVNGKDNVTMPSLNEENSTNLADLFAEAIDPQPDYDDIANQIERYEPECFYTERVAGKMSREGMFVSIEEYVFGEYNTDNLDVTEVAYDSETGSYVFKLTSDNFADVIVAGNVNNDIYYVNGVENNGKKPFMLDESYDWESYEAESTVLVNVDVLGKIMGTKVYAITTYIADYDGTALNNPEYYLEMLRANPRYVGE